MMILQPIVPYHARVDYHFHVLVSRGHNLESSIPSDQPRLLRIESVHPSTCIHPIRWLTHKVVRAFNFNKRFQARYYLLFLDL